MADRLMDGNTRVAWVPTIANLAAPTVAELNAGTLLQDIMTPDGLNVSPDTAAVDTSSLGSTFTTQAAGRRSFSLGLTIKRQSPTDTGWNLLPYRTSGNVVIRRGTTSGTAWTTGQAVEVYPVQTGEPQQANPAPNETERFTVPVFMTADPQTRAVVA